jgi:BlaI family transcriptional regulator, penicillinase repressor
MHVTLRHMTYSNSSNRTLTELQQAIIDFLWRHGAATSEQVREGLMPDHPLKDSSIRTLLRRLEANGYLRHRVEGKTFLYEADAPPQTAAVGTVRKLIERFWGGSAEEFVAGMVDAEILSEEALQRLARKIKEAK